MAVWGDRIIIAGNLAPIESGVPLPTATLFLRDVTGSALQPPSGDWLFAYPKLVTDAAGVLHFLWAEPATRPQSFDAWSTRMTSLWHASLRKSGWTKPELLLKADDVSWGPEEGHVIADSAGVVHVVSSARGGAAPKGLTYFAIRQDSIARTAVGVTAAYASVAMRDADGLIVYSGLDPAARRSHNALMVMRSSDRGRSWSAPSSVMSVQGARIPLVANFGGRWHLTWMQSLSDTIGHESLVYASSDDGTEWPTPLSRQRPDVVTLTQSFTSDECGRVYGVLSQIGRDGLSIREVRLTVDGIVEQEFSPESPIAFSPALVWATGAPRMIWSANSGDDQPVVLRYATRRACGCAKQ
jgi:hypothetical protein